MTDVLEVLHRLGDMAYQPACKLRTAIAEAQVVLDKLEAFVRDTEDAEELVAASDIMPNASASIPERSGLTRKETA